MSDFYVYKHVRLDTNTTFYIGKGRGKRSKDVSGRNDYWKRIVQKHGHAVKILFNNLTEKQALNKESQFIKLFKKYNRCEANFALGGVGSSGFKVSEETKQKLSNIFKGRKFREYGKLSDITKSKISKSRKKARANRLGCAHKKESKDKNAISNGGKQFTAINKITNKVEWSGVNQAECARILSLHQGHISSCLLGRRKSHRGYTFRYGDKNVI